MTESLPLCDRDAWDLARDIRAGLLCPVALMEATLARIAQLNPTVNAICTLADDAMAQAENARDMLARGAPVGPLCGLPVGIKDVTATAGLRTTYGSPLYANHVPERDALIVSRLRRAGAIVIGKTNTPEFATGGHTDNALFGPTRNPWDTSRTAGGSTGGGAAALASGMCALAEGTDLGGSLRIPAAFCGVVGLRPSVGLVPTVPSPLPWDTLQVSGPMARTVPDLALMLSAIAGPNHSTPIGRGATSHPYINAARRAIPPGFRIGFVEDVSGRGVEPELVDVAHLATHELADMGAKVRDMVLDLSSGHDTFLTLRGLWMLGQHRQLAERVKHGQASQIGDNLLGNLKLGLALSADAVAAAQAVQARIFGQVMQLFEEIDVLITPTVAVPAFTVAQGPPAVIAGRRMQSYIDWVAPTYLLTLTSLPVLAVPCGLDEHGMPVSVQIAAPVGCEERLLMVGSAIAARAAIGRPRLLTDAAVASRVVKLASAAALTAGNLEDADTLCD